MIPAKDLYKAGVSKATADTFVATNYGGPSPGERDSPAGSESFPNQATDSGGRTSTGVDTTPGGNGTSATPVFNWEQYLTNWGFTPDIITQLNSIFSTYSDPTQASAAALAYIRGTDWYTQTFPGIQEGEKLGLINDEAGYRSYVNNLNDVYQRYMGRAVTSQEVSNALTGGKSPNQIDAHFQGQAYIAANQNDIQYELGAFDTAGQATPDQLSALGDQTAGLGNMIGPQLQQRIAAAQAKMARVFQGSLATPALSTLNSGALVGTSLGRGINPPDIPT